MNSYDADMVTTLNLNCTVRSKQITDLTGISGFKNLKTLLLKNNALTDPRALRDLENLEQLDLSGNYIHDLRYGIPSLPNLKSLDMSNMGTTPSLTDFGNYYPNLQYLNLSNNDMEDISHLAYMPNLKLLNVDNNRLTNLNCLSSMNIATICARNNRIESMANFENYEPEYYNDVFYGNTIYKEINYGDRVDLPEIFVSAKKSDSIVYDSKGFTCINCRIDGNTVVPDKGATLARVINNDHKITLNIKVIPTVSPAIGTDVQYNLNAALNEMTVVITADREIEKPFGWERGAGRNTVYKEYRYNVSNQDVLIRDVYGNEKIVPISFSEITNSKIAGLEVNYSETMPTQNNVTVTISASEELYGAVDWTLSEDKKSVSKTFTENTDRLIANVVSQRMFNIQMQPEMIDVQVSNIDRTVPVCYTEYLNNTSKTRYSVIVTISSDEDILCPANWGYTGYNGTYNRKSITNSYSENIEEVIQVTDLAGNVTSIPIKITNIDDGVSNFYYDFSMPTFNSPVTLNLSASENINLGNQRTANAPVARIASLNNVRLAANTDSGSNSLTKTYTQDTEEVVSVYDEVGNVELVPVVLSGIDTDAPVIDVKYSTKEITDKSVTVTLEANEKLKYLSGWIPSSDGKSLTKTYLYNTTEAIEVSDMAGNVSRVEITVNNIKNEYNTPTENAKPGNQTKPDTANGPIVNAGQRTFIVIAVIILGGVSYISLRKYRNIKLK